MKPQIITTPTGEQMVVLPLAEYEALLAAAAEAEEDAADVAAFDKAMADLSAGRDALLPAEVSAMITRGASLLSALRRWRGVKQTDLAAGVGIAQGYLSDMESGRRNGSPETLAKIARRLDVPADWLA